jgi:Phage Tail Protein X
LQGERLDHLAQRFYGDPLKSWLILDANPEELNPFLLLRPGRRIKVPQNRVAP